MAQVVLSQKRFSPFPDGSYFVKLVKASYRPEKAPDSKSWVDLDIVVQPGITYSSQFVGRKLQATITFGLQFTDALGEVHDNTIASSTKLEALLVALKMPLEGQFELVDLVRDINTFGDLSKVIVLTISSYVAKDGSSGYNADWISPIAG